MASDGVDASVTEGEARRALALALDAGWRGGARALKREGRTAALRGALSPGREVVVKTWALGTPWRLARSWLGLTQARRHVRGAERLGRLGVATARVIAVGRGRLPAGEGAARCDVLVMEALAGKSLLRVLDEARRGVAGGMTPAERGRLARAVGEQVALMTRAGWFNRDHKPSNVIVLTPERVAVIDTVGIRRDRSRLGGARMLTSLMLEPMGVGCAPSRTMRMRALVGATGGAPLVARKRAWRLVEAMVAAHGDPTPRVNPLAGDVG